MVDAHIPDYRWGKTGIAVIVKPWRKGDAQPRAHSNQSFHRYTGLAIFCPITNRIKDDPRDIVPAFYARLGPRALPASLS